MLSILCRLPDRLPCRQIEEEEGKVCVLIDGLRIVYAKSLFVPIWVFRHNHLCTPRRSTDLNNTLGEKLRNLLLNEILVILAETPGFSGDRFAVRQ